MIPRGVQCYFGEEVNRRRKVESILAATMKNWGFQEIILPFFDYLEDFSYGLGPHIGDQVYRFLDSDGSLLALRPDLTTLVAKTVATRMTEHPQPIKLFYSGEVFRQTRAGAGRQKEFYQVGLESIGSVMLWADIEVLLLAIECLLQLGVEGSRIALGHVGFFNGIISVLNLPPDRADAVRKAVDDKDSAWLRREVDALEISVETKKFLADLPDLAGGREVLESALSVVENSRSREALNELVQIHSTFESLGLQDYLIFDLAEVRGLDYYTGIVFKIYGRAQGFELGGGGRYDGLLRKFGWDLPAVGFSFTMDRLLPLIPETERLEVPLSGAGEHVIAVGSAPPQEVFRRVWQLRRRGERVRVGGND
jgi:ATP phosphoribosyltransferase regulatory subunit